jgi:hypothetical protein
MRFGNNLQEINLPIRVRLEISSASGEQGRRRGGLSFQFKSLSLRNKRIHGEVMRTVHQERKPEKRGKLYRREHVLLEKKGKKKKIYILNLKTMHGQLLSKTMDLP